jgi:hypothetical protein
VISAEPITDVDTTAADMLEELDEDLDNEGMNSLVFAEMKGPVREKIERYELTRTINPAHFVPTLGSSVDAFLRPPTLVDEAQSGSGGDSGGDGAAL